MTMYSVLFAEVAILMSNFKPIFCYHILGSHVQNAKGWMVTGGLSMSRNGILGSSAHSARSFFSQGINAAHKIRQCVECRESFTGPNLNRHLCEMHRWKQCLYCDRVEPPRSYEEHISLDHRFENCTVCGKEEETTRLRSHLVGIEGAAGMIAFAVFGHFVVSATAHLCM